MPSSFLYDLWRTFFPAYLTLLHIIVSRPQVLAVYFA